MQRLPDNWVILSSSRYRFRGYDPDDPSHCSAYQTPCHIVKLKVQVQRLWPNDPSQCSAYQTIGSYCQAQGTGPEAGTKMIPVITVLTRQLGHIVKLRVQVQKLWPRWSQSLQCLLDNWVILSSSRSRSISWDPDDPSHCSVYQTAGSYCQAQGPGPGHWADIQTTRMGHFSSSGFRSGRCAVLIWRILLTNWVIHQWLWLVCLYFVDNYQELGKTFNFLVDINTITL